MVKGVTVNTRTRTRLARQRRRKKPQKVWAKGQTIGGNAKAITKGITTNSMKPRKKENKRELFLKAVENRFSTQQVIETIQEDTPKEEVRPPLKKRERHIRIGDQVITIPVQAASMEHCSNESFNDALNASRDALRKKWKSSKRRVATMDTLRIKEAEALDYLARTGNEPPPPRRRRRVGTLHDLYDPIVLGKAALKATNAYRRLKGKKALKWSQPLCKIGTVHSKNMALKKVPFGHHGFSNRVRLYPFPHHGAAENVALHTSCASVAENVVQGWIRSPGHEKNLVSSSTYCGIGVHPAADGILYFTQLFASCS